MDENMGMNNENKPENEQSGVRFDVENTVEVVSVDNAAKKSSKLPVIIVAAVLVVAVIVAAVVFFVGSGDESQDDVNLVGEEASTDEENTTDVLFWYIDAEEQEGFTDEEGVSITKEEYVSKIQTVVNEATTTLSEDVGSYNPNTIVENTTVAVTQGTQGTQSTQGTQAVDTENVDKAEAEIKAFFNRSCYMKGAMYGSGEGNSLVMSMDGDNFEILTNLDGTEVSVLCLDGVLYIKRPATMQYLELTEAVMSLIGMDFSDMNFDFGDADYNSMKEKFVGTYEVDINGESGICHEYKSEDQIYRFYSVDGSLKEIDICDSNGVSDTQLVIDYFSQSIPGDQLTLKGYTASSVTTIFADLM